MGNLKSLFRSARGRFHRAIEYRGSEVLSGIEGNALIHTELRKSEPNLVGRIGATEMRVLRCMYFRGGQFDNKTRWNAHTYSGIFPTSNGGLEDFARKYRDAIAAADILGVWFNRGEGRIIASVNPRCKTVALRSLEPYYWDNSWSQVLAHKRVLVVHPFVESISSQYRQRQKLFLNPNVLPPFELSLVQAVQSLRGNDTLYRSWGEALNSMKERIANKSFDVALIGAGAYGLPLGAFVKSLGKQAVNLGGALQVLFGIKGARWDGHEIISKLYNDYWTRPLPSETFPDAKNVEEGCYW